MGLRPPPPPNFYCEEWHAIAAARRIRRLRIATEVFYWIRVVALSAMGILFFRMGIL